MASRKRSGSGSKRPKEKVVYIYELLFRGEDPVNNNNEFWDSFFLLQPNVESLENELTKLSNDQLLLVKENIKLLFIQSIQMLESGLHYKIESYEMSIRDDVKCKFCFLCVTARSSEKSVEQFTNLVCPLLCHLQKTGHRCWSRCDKYNFRFPGSRTEYENANFPLQQLVDK